MSRHFEVAIVGGGIYGSAIAYFLSKQRIKAVLLERGVIGAEGATGYSGGIVRVYDPDPVLARFSLMGVREFKSWSLVGYPGISPYHNSGCVYRIGMNNWLDADNLTKELKTMGYRGEIVVAPEKDNRFSWLADNEEHVLMWEQDSGYGNPRLAARNLAQGSSLNGVLLYERCHVNTIEPGGGKWKISLDYGDLTANVVLLTGGAYSTGLLKGLPVVTRSISLLRVSAPFRKKTIGYPVVDEVTGTYFRPLENGGYYCGTQVFEETTTPDRLSGFGLPEMTDAWNRVQQLVRPEYLGRPLNGFKGFDGYTTSKRPLVGFMPGHENLFVTTGFSGRGFKYALPLAKAVTWKICNSIGKDAQIENFDSSLCRLVEKFTI